MNPAKKTRCILLVLTLFALAGAAAARESTVWLSSRTERLYKQKAFGQALNSFRRPRKERRVLFDARPETVVALETPRQSGRGVILALIDEFSSERFFESRTDQIDKRAGTR
jgi:hypothetical protein